MVSTPSALTTGRVGGESILRELADRVGSPTFDATIYRRKLKRDRNNVHEAGTG